jgi:hypothetical protein
VTTPDAGRDGKLLNREANFMTKKGSPDVKRQAANRRAVEPSVKAPDEFARRGRPAAALRRASSAVTGSLNAADVLALQRSVGNRAVRRLLERRAGRQPFAPFPVQAKSREGAADSTDIRETHTKDQGGLTDNLKAAVERLSGVSMGGVKVHYNSPEPSRLDALAYTRGAEIYVGPGQEGHVPHEAWHVAQQRQGRVGTTTRVGGVDFNDDPGLESEADLMGERANAGAGHARPPAPVSLRPSPNAAAPVQRVTASQSKELSALVPELNALRRYFSFIPSVAYADADKLRDYFTTEPITEVSTRLGEVAGAIERLSESDARGGAIDDLILDSIASRLRTLVRVMDGAGEKYIEFVSNDKGASRDSDAHPLTQTKDALYHAYYTLGKLLEPRGGSRPHYADKLTHIGPVMMDAPPMPNEARVSAQEPKWLSSFRESSNLLTRLRDTYGLARIAFTNYEGQSSRRRTNELLFGLRRVIGTQTHSYLNSEVNLVVDFTAKSGEDEQKALVKYLIDDRGNVEIRIEHLIPKSKWDAEKEPDAPPQYGVTDERVLKRQEELIGQYGFKEFREESGARWRLSELDSLDDTLKMILGQTPEVKEMLDQLLVIRTLKVKDKGEAFYDGKAHVLSISSSTFEDISFAGRGLKTLPYAYKVIAHELGHLILAAPHRKELFRGERRMLSEQSSYAQKSGSSAVSALKDRISWLESNLDDDPLFPDPEISARWAKMTFKEVIAETKKMEEELKALREQLAKLEGSAKKPTPSLFSLSDDDPEESMQDRTRYLTKEHRKPTVGTFKELMKTWGVGPITVYAAQEEGKVDEEMLAEAYALFVTDPYFVMQISPAMYKWFETKQFLRPD